MKEVRSLTRSYVTCSSERQSVIERNWDAADRVNHTNLVLFKEATPSESENSGGGLWKTKSKERKANVEDNDLSHPYKFEETNPFTLWIRNSDPKKNTNSS